MKLIIVLIVLLLPAMVGGETTWIKWDWMILQGAGSTPSVVHPVDAMIPHEDSMIYGPYKGPRYPIKECPPCPDRQEIRFTNPYTVFLPCPEQPAPVRWEYGYFDLSRGWLPSGTSHWGRPSASHKTSALNALLREGWEVQGKYDGEVFLWLKRRVEVEK